MTTCALLLTAMTAAALGTDTQGHYLIGTATDWRDFAAVVEQTPTANAKMTADIDLGDDQTMIGTYEKPFQGTFDGQGHSLTLAYEATENSIAPFRYVKDATIEAIHIKGSIHTTGMAIGGVACYDSSSGRGSTVRRCWVSALLSADVVSGSLQNSLGGIFQGPANDAVIEDCLFDGKFADQNSQWNGGFVNVCSTVTIRNSLNLGTFPPGNGCGTFNRTDCKLENCYFLNAYGTEQGTKVTEAQLADGTVTNLLQAGRAEEVWTQDAVTKRPMLKVFASSTPGDATPGGTTASGFICWLLNGGTVTWQLSEQPKVELIKGQFVISSTRATVYYAADDVEKFTLDTNGAAAIDRLMAGGNSPSVSREDGQLVVSGCRAGESVTVYQASGRESQRLRADGNGRLQLALDALPAGVYIVKSESVTFKIAKK